MRANHLLKLSRNLPRVVPWSGTTPRNQKYAVMDDVIEEGCRHADKRTMALLREKDRAVGAHASRNLRVSISNR
ncbi:hypothetical protein MRX96_050508 [Rhipicephalus microplus]